MRIEMGALLVWGPTNVGLVILLILALLCEVVSVVLVIIVGASILIHLAREITLIVLISLLSSGLPVVRLGVVKLPFLVELVVLLRIVLHAISLRLIVLMELLKLRVLFLVLKNSILGVHGLLLKVVGLLDKGGVQVVLVGALFLELGGELELIVIRELLITLAIVVVVVVVAVSLLFLIESVILVRTLLLLVIRHKLVKVVLKCI